MKKLLLLTMLLVLAAVAEAGEQRRIFDAQGRSIGTATTDSQGTTTFRDERGRTTGTSTRRGDFFDARGNRTSSVRR